MRNVDKLVKLCEKIRVKEKQLCIQVGVAAEQYIQRCVLTVSNENSLKIPYVHEQTETSILGFYSLHYSVNPCGNDSVVRPVTQVKQACTQLASIHVVLSLPKRARYDTPTKSTLQCMISTCMSSPAVSVSYLCLVIIIIILILCVL